MLPRRGRRASRARDRAALEQYMEDTRDEEEARTSTAAIETLTTLLRRAAAGAAGAGERPDLHGLRRPRRDRRLEPRARLARPRVHVAHWAATSSRTRSSPTSRSRTGATTRCATGEPPFSSAAHARARATSPTIGDPDREGLDDDRAARAADDVRAQPARPGEAGAAAQVALHDRRPAPPRRRARHAHAALLPLALPAAGAPLGEGARGPAARPARQAAAARAWTCSSSISQTPPVAARGRVER